MLIRIVPFALVLAFGGIANAATPAEQALKQQLDKLQAQYLAAEKQNNALQLQLSKVKANDGTDGKTIVALRQQVDQLQADLKKAKGNDTADDKSFKLLQSQIDALRKVRTVRTIVYKPKADTSKGEVQSLADDANQFFVTAKPVRGVWAGRAGADAGEYQVVIVLLFDDANGLQVFQKDPQWKRFTDKHAKMWEEPKYYDGTVGK